LAVAFSPDGENLAYAGGGGSVIIRRVAQRSNRIVIHDGPFLVRSLAFSPNSRHLAGATVNEELPEESDVIVWNVPKGKRIARLDKHPRCAHCLAFSPDGKLLAVGVHGGFKLWNVKQRGPWQSTSFHSRSRPGSLALERPKGLPPIDAVTGAAFSPDSNTLMLLVRKSELYSWELNKQRVVGESCRKVGKVLASVDFLTQNDQVVTCGFQLAKGRIRGEVCIWDIKHRTVIAEIASMTGQQRGLLKSCVSLDGKIIAAMENFRIWVWKVV
jgi:WD40 repeat protein